MICVYKKSHYIYIMSTVKELINEQVTSLQKRLAQETKFNDGLKHLLEVINAAVGDIQRNLQYIGNKDKELSLLKTKIEAQTEKLQAKEQLDSEAQKAVSELGAVVGELNQIDFDPKRTAPDLDGDIARAQKAISLIQSQLATMTNPQNNTGGGGRRRRRKGGYSYRKKSPSARKTRKGKKSKTRSKGRSRTRSKTRSRTR